MMWIFGISTFLFVFSALYRLIHVRNDVRITKSAKEGGLDMSLGTLNGCGTSVFGSFSTNHPDPNVRVYYVFLSILFIPILPIGCFLARKGGKSVAGMGLETQYNIYGQIHWRLAEVISCYWLVWAICAVTTSLYLE